MYAAEEGVPGMFRYAPGMSPAKIAMAAVVIIAAMAAVGSI